MTNQPLLLTDDEVVALSHDAETMWPGGVPTDPLTANTIEEAVFRGNRSLLVRGMNAETMDAETRDLLQKVLHSTSYLTVFHGSDSLERVSWALSSNHYAAGDDWILETISPVGVHRLSTEPAADQQAYLQALLESVVAAGPSGEGGDSEDQGWLYVLALGTESAHAVRGRRGRLSGAELVISEDGLSTPGGWEDVDTAEEAVLGLVDRLAGMSI